jgi:hypothetical protein
MSFGFGFGRPHYVAVLGGTPFTAVYFASLTSRTYNNLAPATLSIDSSDNITVFGDNDTGAGITGFAFRLTSSGVYSFSKSLSNSTDSGTVAVLDSSGNYYVGTTASIGCCCCGYYLYPEFIKLDSTLSTKLSGINSGYGNGYASEAANTPYIDGAGNIFFTIYDGIIKYDLIKVNSALNSVTVLVNSNTSASAVFVSSSSKLIYAGAYFTNLCCAGDIVLYALVYSVPAATPTSTPDWSLYEPTGTVGYFNTSTVDSANNVYVGLTYNGIPTSNRLYQIDSSGTVQWQYTYSGVNYFQKLATDSLGNIYAVSTSATNTITLVKVGPSGTVQFARNIVVTPGALSNPKIVIKGSVMYISATFTPSTGNKQAFIVKLPTNGSLTQTILITGTSYALSYISLTVTQSVGTQVSLVAGSFPLIAVSPTTSASIVSPTAVSSGVATAVKTL